MSTDQHCKRIHWRQVETRNATGYVYPSSKPDSAKEDLRRFVKQHNLSYRVRRGDPLTEFEDLFEQLHLSSDDELLDRAERRDLPAKIQLLAQRRKDRPIPTEYATSKDRTITAKRHQQASSRTVPTRRSATPNIILDDFAFRKYNRCSSYGKLNCPPQDQHRCVNKKFYKYFQNPLHEKDKSICYMSLASFDDCSFSESSSIRNPYDTVLNRPHRFRDANVICDDLLNRKLRQSTGARVLPPHPPFGIPNSPVISYMHTYPQSDYSRIEPDLKELHKKRYRSRESLPHLINDDMAFRSLRKELKHGLKEFDDVEVNLTRSVSTSNLSLAKIRAKLKPVKSSSVTSSSLSLSSPDASDCSLPYT